jgi:hypothetical protein
VRRVTVSLIAACCALFATACSSQQSDGKPKAEAPSAQQQPEDDGVTDAQLGRAVTVHGTDGNSAYLTLTGVAYRDGSTKDTDAPARWAVALAFRLTAKGHPTSMGAPIDGLSFNWVKDDQQATHVDAVTPWEGCTNAYMFNERLVPAQAHQAIVDLNVPAKGGQLVLDTGQGDFIRWNLPTSDEGTGYEPATKYATAYC